MKHETMDMGKQFKCIPDTPTKGSPDGMDMGGENKRQSPKKQINGGLPDDHISENPKDDY